METRPMYIKIDDFEELSLVVKEIRSKTERVKEKIEELKAVKEKEAESIRDWESRINHLADKVASVENSLMNPR